MGTGRWQVKWRGRAVHRFELRWVEERGVAWNQHMPSSGPGTCPSTPLGDRGRYNANATRNMEHGTRCARRKSDRGERG